MKNELPHLLTLPLPQGGRASQRIGVVLPLADASPRLSECLAALSAALANALAHGHQADLYIVVDGRNADSAAIACTCPAHLVTADFSDLASARAIGARAALNAGATWLAFTHSSALVAESWLIEQISCDTELLLGNVEITNSFMSAPRKDDRCDWHQLNAHALAAVAANFSNLGMSRAAFELASHLGGGRLRLDAALLDQLASLEVATQRCSKPLVYARMQPLDEMLFGADSFSQPVRALSNSHFETVPTHPLAYPKASLLKAGPVTAPLPAE